MNGAAGGPRLVGVAYTTLVAGRGRPPAFPFAGAWHEHSGGVTEESLPIRHSAHAHAATADAADEDTPRALALADDHDGYHHMVLRSTLALAGREDSLAARIVALHQGRTERAAHAMRATGRLTARESDRLAAGWESLWLDLEAALPGRAADLRRLRQQM